MIAPRRFTPAKWNSAPVALTSQKTAWLALLLATVLFAFGCGEPASSVYIDNGRDAPMVVKIDGQPAAMIEAGQFTLVRVMPGERHFHIQCAGETLFDGKKTLDTAKGFLSPRQYMFNPGGEHRYASCKVLYGSQAFADATQSAIVKFAEYQAGEKADPTRVEFSQIKRFAEPMPTDNWFELPGGISYILRDAPESVYTRSGSESRRVLTRISAVNHAQLVRCHAVESPTELDVITLVAAAEAAIDTLSQLERSP